jgi:hypothetical protein
LLLPDITLIIDIILFFCRFQCFSFVRLVLIYEMPPLLPAEFATPDALLIRKISVFTNAILTRTQPSPQR